MEEARRSGHSSSAWAAVSELRVNRADGGRDQSGPRLNEVVAVVVLDTAEHVDGTRPCGLKGVRDRNGRRGGHLGRSARPRREGTSVRRERVGDEQLEDGPTSEGVSQEHSTSAELGSGMPELTAVFSTSMNPDRTHAPAAGIVRCAISVRAGLVSTDVPEPNSSTVLASVGVVLRGPGGPPGPEGPAGPR